MRDPGGLLLLLIMPAALIIVMALVQDAPYRDYQEMKFEILVVNNDKGSVGSKIIEGLKKNKSFIVVSAIHQKKLNEADLRTNLREGKYQMGIIIPEDATAALVNTSNKLANEMAKTIGVAGSLPVKAMIDTSSIELVFDPVVKPSFRSALNYALNQYITQVKI